MVAEDLLRIVLKREFNDHSAFFIKIFCLNGLLHNVLYTSCMS